MRALGFQRYKYSGDLYKFVIETVGSNSTTNYYFVNTIALNAGTDISGKMTIKSDQPMQIGSLIANLKDANGLPVLGDIVWQISNLQPIFNAFNAVEGYKMKAVKFQGTI